MTCQKTSYDWLENEAASEMITFNNLISQSKNCYFEPRYAIFFNKFEIFHEKIEKFPFY